MSAYIVGDQTINRIVSHLKLNRDLEWLRTEFCEVCAATSDAEIGAALFKRTARPSSLGMESARP